MIYFVRRKDGVIKIGFTAANVARRKTTLEVAHGKLELLGEIDGGLDTEKSIHARFSDARIDDREWFRPTDELIAYIHEASHPHKRIELERIELPDVPYPKGAKKVKLIRLFGL